MAGSYWLYPIINIVFAMIVAIMALILGVYFIQYMNGKKTFSKNEATIIAVFLFITMVIAIVIVVYSIVYMVQERKKRKKSQIGEK